MSTLRGSIVTHGEIRQSITRRIDTAEVILEIGTRDSAVRVTYCEYDLSREVRVFMSGLYHQHRECLNADFLMLYEYLKESGRVINLTPDIANQTIQFLKETY